MKKNTSYYILSMAVLIIGLSSCEKIQEKKGDNSKQSNLLESQKKDEVAKQQDNSLSYESYTFAEKLKNENFFENDNLNKEIELKNVGITSYGISGNEVKLTGVFYDKQKNIMIPTENTNRPGSAFVPMYYDKLAINYNEKYNSSYWATLEIILKDPRTVEKLKMYLASEPYRTYEYKIDGGMEPEYRIGFIDLVNVKGKFTGKNSNLDYTFIDAQIK